MKLEYLFYAILIGIVPALLWLWIWLHEDSEHPEPKSILIISFVAGMFVAPIAVILQLLSESYFANLNFIFAGVVVSWSVVAWVIIEELLKFGASFFALKSKAFNEPVDAMIYLITASLGFVAVENTLFAIKNVIEGGLMELFSGGIIRMIGPSLLHIATSGMVGLFISLAFYMNHQRKTLFIYFGLALAIILHTFYNLFIISKKGGYISTAFISVWILAIILASGFHFVKKMHRIPIKAE